MLTDEQFMRRAFDLARLGAGNASPNPMVGAVIVFENKIIGEGFHQKYGGPHAEVHAVNNVAKQDEKLLPHSTIYVSLEPCCIFGKTPPCTSLIIEKKIPRVVISSVDQTSGVAGKGIQMLKDAGIEVVTGILKKQGDELCKIRNFFVTQQRPYVILKYAETQDGFMGKKGEQVWISNALSKRIVHKWRSEIDAILVGTNTARQDNPRLTNRFYFGKSPLRVILDRQLSLPQELHVFEDQLPTWVITQKRSEKKFPKNVRKIEVDFGENFLPKILKLLHEQDVTVLMVEGGAQLLGSFIEEKLWDEAYIFESQIIQREGIISPNLNLFKKNTYKINDNLLKFFSRHPI